METGSQMVRRRGGVIHAPTRVRGGYATYFLRAYAGAPVAQTLRLSLLRYGERLYDTLRALPENVATPYAYWSKRAVLSTLLQGHPSSLRFEHPDVAYG